MSFTPCSLINFSLELSLETFSLLKQNWVFLSQYSYFLILLLVHLLKFFSSLFFLGSSLTFSFGFFVYLLKFWFMFSDVFLKLLLNKNRLLFWLFKGLFKVLNHVFWFFKFSLEFSNLLIFVILSLIVFFKLFYLLFGFLLPVFWLNFSCCFVLLLFLLKSFNFLFSLLLSVLSLDLSSSFILFFLQFDLLNFFLS